MTFAVLIAAFLGLAMPDKPDASGHITTEPGVSLYYERYGSGPQLVVVPAHLYTYDFARLARPGRTVVLYDMRNRGASHRVEDESRITIRGDIDDLESLRRHFGAEKMSVVGYSYLGLMVAAYASEHPDRIERLVQLGPVPRQFGTTYPEGEAAGEETLGDEAKRAQKEWEDAERAATPSSDQHALCLIQQRAMFLWSLGDSSNLDQVRDTCRYENERPAALARHFGSHFADIRKRQFPVEPFRAVKAPVLTIHGRLDRNAAYGAGREWARTFPDARLITLPNAAHQSWIDDPTVIEDVDAFLAGQWPERAQRLSG